MIACANLANLTLARGISRVREVAIRAAIGAGRWRLVRQFLTESLILSGGGGVLGLLLAYAGLALMKSTMPPDTIPPEPSRSRWTRRVLLFVVGLSVITGVLFGIVPALKATRPDLTSSIKQGGGGASVGHSSRRFRGALVVAEVALAFVLLAGAGLLIRSFFRMQTVETGFDSTNVVTAYLPISERRFRTAEEFELYTRQITDAVGAVPGVRDVAFTSALPLEGWGYGMPVPDRRRQSRARLRRHSRPDCFLQGWLGHVVFQDARDETGSRGAGFLNEALDVKRMAPLPATAGHQRDDGEEILSEPGPGRQANPGGGDRIRPDQARSGDPLGGGRRGRGRENRGPWAPRNDYSPGMYVTSEQSPQTGQAIVVRGLTGAAVLQRSITDAIHRVNKDQVVDDMKTLEQIKVESVAGERFRSILMGIFAGVALLLAAIGLYGVISYSVVQRTREIGIRAALGANPGDIRGLVLRSAMTLTAVGLAIGGAASLGLAQVIASMLFNTGKYDPVTFAAVAGVLGLVALLACLVPARRAMRVNPIVALRND